MRIYANKLIKCLKFKGGVEQGFLNVFPFYEKYLIDRLHLERYLTIILMIIEEQKSIFI